MTSNFVPNHMLPKLYYTLESSVRRIVKTAFVTKESLGEVWKLEIRMHYDPFSQSGK